MKILVITEKPSVAMDISKALQGNFSRQDGYIESNNMIISWAVGHLLELAQPQDYDPGLQRWDINTLPILPDPFQLQPKQATTKQLKIIRDLIKRQDVNRLINGCDAGREGENIFRSIIQFLNCRKPHDRLWLSETTPAAVRASFAHLRSSSEVDNLAKAAVARSQADWIVGINATRGFTVQNGDKMTVGRVQTPTLALIVNREREIENFIPTPYWELEALFTTNDENSYKGKWFSGDHDRFLDRAQAEAVLRKLTPGSPAIVTNIERKEVREQPPQLFNLNDLQKEANKRLGLTAEQTLNISQKLYESRLLTYPRTDSRHLTQTMAATLPNRLHALRGTELRPIVERISATAVNDKRYVDDKKVSDHTAIIITDQIPNMNGLSQQERQVYMMVARRMVAIFLPPARIQKTTIITTCRNETFKTNGKVIVVQGWKVVYSRITADDDEEEPEPTLPALEQNKKLNVRSTEILDKETTPPKHFTEADLLSAMENAGRKIDDEELREAMAGKGLGTPATRAAIIEKLIAVGYLTRQKKALLPTDKGKYLINIVTTELKDAELTAEWEKKLLDVEQGRYQDTVFMREIKQFITQIICDLKNKPAVKRDFSSKSLGACPICGKPVIESKKNYGCSGWKEGCKFVIWKEIAHKKITETQAAKLLKTGKTGVIKGFKSKKGTDFESALRLDQDGKVAFDFNKKA